MGSDFGRQIEGLGFFNIGWPLFRVCKNSGSVPFSVSGHLTFCVAFNFACGIHAWTGSVPRLNKWKRGPDAFRLSRPRARQLRQVEEPGARPPASPNLAERRPLPYTCIRTAPGTAGAAGELDTGRPFIQINSPASVPRAKLYWRRVASRQQGRPTRIETAPGGAGG
jgi:hypothetical protein